MFLDSGNKTECFGCEGCAQICSVGAISIQEDSEGFRYPVVDTEKCVQCGQCRRICPHDNMPVKATDDKYVFGGYSLDNEIRFNSTSGGAFSAIAEVYCDEDYVVFGAEANGLYISHSCITDKKDLYKFRKSKYSQSVIGNSYRQVKSFLKEGKKVLFSGTPCQIAGLLAFLGNTDRRNLLTVEVVCEGVPSPLYIRKMEEDLENRYGEKIKELDYRYTGRSVFSNGTWDFQKMKIRTEAKEIVKDRWFNPFWSIWLQHLMSRPSCYKCPFTNPERNADITLGDLWGVHIYCPELYGKNGGASLVICNTEKGKAIFQKVQEHMFGHELRFEDAIKYQGPIRKPIAENPDRDRFMVDLKNNMEFSALNKKWAKRPTIKLLFQKYIWGNRQKVFFWSLFHKKNQMER